MTRNDILQAEADRLGAVFSKSALATAEQFSPSRLLDQIVGDLDPEFALLEWFTTGAKRNPFVLLAAAGGLWFLVRQLPRLKSLPNSLTRQGKRPLRLSREIREGDKK